MPGPLGTLGPTVDPNWAWDTPGWTNQGNTSDTEGVQLAGQSNLGASVLIEPAALSGFLARTIDPDLSAVGAFALTASSTTSMYGALMQTYDPIITKNVCYTYSVGTGSTGTQSHQWIALVNPGTGVVYAVTADAGATAASAGFNKVAWTATTVLPPAQYLVLYANIFTAWGTLQPKLGGIATLAAEAQGLLATTQTTSGPITPYDRFAVYSALTAFTVAPAVGTIVPNFALCTVTPSTAGVFFGLV
jgi:hypothetical protein